MASIVENANTSNFYTFYICNQEDFDNMANKIHTLPKESHIMLCFHGHGAKKTHDYIVTIGTPRKCIFIRDENVPSLDLNHIIKTSLENDQFIYNNNSCQDDNSWNSRHDEDRQLKERREAEAMKRRHDDNSIMVL
jgi:hypothetical protein